MLATVAMALTVASCGIPEKTETVRPHSVLELRATLSTDEVLLSTVKSLSANEQYVFLHLQSEQRILVYTADGLYVRTIGRAGGGPGEFRELVRMGLLGDTLWTMDWELRRLSLFESSGELLRITSTGDEVTGPSNGGSALIYQPMPESLTPAGEVMSYGGVWLKNLTDGTAMRSPLLLGPPEGGVLDTIGWYSLKNSGLFLRGLGGPQPIPDFELAVYDGPGGKACVVQRDEVLRAAVVNATVTCLGTDADTLWQRTLAFDVATVAPSVADSIRQWYYEKLRSKTKVDIDAALHIPTYWPPVTEAFAGADGAIWLRGAEVRDSVTYTVLDRGGVDRVDVRVPKEIRIRWANGDVVWAEQLDEDDVPTVSRFSIVVPDHGD